MWRISSCRFARGRMIVVTFNQKYLESLIINQFIKLQTTVTMSQNNAFIMQAIFVSSQLNFHDGNLGEPIPHFQRYSRIRKLTGYGCNCQYFSGGCVIHQVLQSIEIPSPFHTCASGTTKWLEMCLQLQRILDVWRVCSSMQFQ